MKGKGAIVFLSILAVFLFLPLFPVQGQCPTGLVPCGTPKCPCTLCHFFVMIARIITFILGRIIPALAVLMVAIGGFLYLIAGMEGLPEMKSKANSLFKSIVIGLFIAYGAWLIMGMFFTAIGVMSWTGLGTWWEINCN